MIEENSRRKQISFASAGNRQTNPAIFEIYGNIRIRVDSGKRLRKIRHLPARFQFALYGGPVFRRMRKNIVEIIVLLNERDRGLFPDTSNARNIIRTVAHKRLDIHYLPGFVTDQFLEIFFRKFQEFAHARLGNIDVRARIDELIRIAVAGNDDAVYPIFEFSGKASRSDRPLRILPFRTYGYSWRTAKIS